MLKNGMMIKKISITGESTTIFKMPFEEPIEHDDEELLEAVEKIVDLFYTCDKVRLESHGKYLVIRNINSDNATFIFETY